jgi:hypothetical protein
MSVIKRSELNSPGSFVDRLKPLSCNLIIIYIMKKHLVNPECVGRSIGHACGSCNGLSC